VSLNQIKKDLVLSLSKQKNEKGEQLTKELSQYLIDELAIFSNLIVEYIITNKSINLNSEQDEEN
jgi:heme/copper-type cytochrome/quinol oxidase subunit 3